MESKCNSKESRMAREKCKVYSNDEGSWNAKTIFAEFALEAGNERCRDMLNSAQADTTPNQRKRLSTGKYKCNRNTPIDVRNERERNRVQAINEAFARLRKIIPYTANRSKRVSKAKTLRKAVQYIHELQSLLMKGSRIGYRN